MQVFLHAKSIVVADLPGFIREGYEGKGPHEHVIDAPHVADADLSAEEMGRLCYLSGHRPNPKTATNQPYLLNICNERHYSVLGHSAASVYIEGVSRNCTHEIIRSRWFSFSEVSQRYVDVSDFKFVQHPGLVDLDPFDQEQLDLAWESTKEVYSILVKSLMAKGYKRKEARQAARSILPGGIETKIGMSGNLRAWRDFLAQRLAPGADEEIQGVAREIFKIMKAEFPNSFQDFDSHGLITTERLIRRALARLDTAMENGVTVGTTPLMWPSLVRKDFEDEVRNIMNKGLWILEEDPWDEEKIGSNI